MLYQDFNCLSISKSYSQLILKQIGIKFDNGRPLKTQTLGERMVNGEQFLLFEILQGVDGVIQFMSWYHLMAKYCMV